VADWKSFQIPIPLTQVVDPIKSLLETLMIFLEILKAILETIKIFLLDLLNPIKALVEALIGLLIELIQALLASGCYIYFDIPDPVNDPDFSRVAGGYPAFLERFEGSLYDTKDFNRPQPNDLTTSGFILFVLDAANIIELILAVQAIMRLFGKAWKSPRYAAPANVKAIPVGTSGDPILAVTSLFTKGPIEKIELQWDLPSVVESPDPGFSDAVTKLAGEFIPPNFLIEKSVDILPTSQKIDIADLGTTDSVGLVQVDVPTKLDKALASSFAKVQGTTVFATQPLRDNQQEPVIKFQKYMKADTTAGILGALTGTFRFIDDDVEVGHVYYYRIRAYSGDLNLDTTNFTIGGLPTSYNALTSGTKNNSQIRFFEWPSSGDEVVMGKPSAVVRATVPPDLGDFDVLENLRRLFLVALSLDFHIPFPRDKNGAAVVSVGPPVIPLQFDATGNPVAPTPPSAVGKGSLTNQASRLAGFQSSLLVGKLAGLDAPGDAFSDPGLADLTVMPWQRFNVRNTAARLANGVASAMLSLNGGEVTTFQNYMQGNPPRGPVSTQFQNVPGNPPLSTLSGICFAFTTPEDPKVTPNTNQTLTTFLAAYDDTKLRQNVLTVVTFLKNFTLGGVPPDWISVSPLRDLIPWAMALLYDIVAKIQALLDAFQGFLDEIVKFIDNLERKIDAMETFVQFLIDILDFIEDLNFGVFVLAANNLSGDVSTWVTTIDEATGSPPPSGPGGYTAGICIAYALFSPGALVTALQTIFGG